MSERMMSVTYRLPVKVFSPREDSWLDRLRWAIYSRWYWGNPPTKHSDDYEDTTIDIPWTEYKMGQVNSRLGREVMAVEVWRK